MASQTLAWTASIAPAQPSLTLVDIAAGPTNDVIVADKSGGATFEQHRWTSAGAVVSNHQDQSGAYAGTLWTSGLFADAGNDVFYGMLLTGLPQGTNNGVELLWNRLNPAGTVVFSATTTGVAPAASGAPSVTFLQAGGDASANLHGGFVMANPQSVGQGVYCYDYTGAPEGAAAQQVTTLLTAQDYLWPTTDNGLALFKAVTATTNFGCGTLTVPAGGGVVLGKFTGGGACTWNKLLALPTAAIHPPYNFRIGVDGSLVAAVAYSGTINFGLDALSSPGGTSLGIARFDSAGNPVWNQNVVASAGGSVAVGSIGVNAAGITIVTGRYAGTVALGGTTLPASADTFLAVFDTMGKLKWSKTVTVGAQSKLLAAAGKCGLVLATDSPTVNLGTGALSTLQNGVESIGVAALGL